MFLFYVVSPIFGLFICLKYNFCKFSHFLSFISIFSFIRSILFLIYVGLMYFSMHCRPIALFRQLAVK